MRRLKLVFYMIIMVILINNAYSLYGKAKEESNINAFLEREEVDEEKLIDSKIILEKLSEKIQVVGLEGEVTKEFNYADNKWYGDKYYKMELFAKFKLGFNVNEIRAEDVTVINNNVIIDMPEIALISLEVPYDKILIDKKDGLFRKNFSEEDRQFLYESAYNSIEKQILNDSMLISNAEENNEIAIRSILMLIPEIESISFK